MKPSGTHDDPHEALPLSETTFFILVSLDGEPRHGYAIMKDVQALSDGRVKLSTGTLYGAIRRLLDDGWITRVSIPEEEIDGRERKSYTLTRRGRRVLAAETQRLRDLVGIAAWRSAQGVERGGD